MYQNLRFCLPIPTFLFTSYALTRLFSAPQNLFNITQLQDMDFFVLKRNKIITYNYIILRGFESIDYQLVIYGDINKSVGIVKPKQHTFVVTW